MAFCNTAEKDLPKSIRSSLLKQANQRRIVPYHERVVPPPVGTILESHSLGTASVSSLSSGDTGAYDAPVVADHQPKPRVVANTTPVRRPTTTTATPANRKDALQKHRRNFHQPNRAAPVTTKGFRTTSKAPPAPEHTPRQAQPRPAQPRPRPIVVSGRTQRQETRDEILSKARETIQRNEARETTQATSTLPSTTTRMGKIDRNEILQLLEDTTTKDDETISLSSRDFDIKSAAGSKTEVATTVASKPLNLPNRLPTKHLDLDSCFTGSTCSTITASVGYVAPHLETRVEAARRNQRRLEAAYHRTRPIVPASSASPSEALRAIRERQDPPTDTNITKKANSTPRSTVKRATTPTTSNQRRKNDPTSLRRSTDSRAGTVKATGNRLRILREETLYSKKILREDHSEHEI